MIQYTCILRNGHHRRLVSTSVTSRHYLSCCPKNILDLLGADREYLRVYNPVMLTGVTTRTSQPQDVCLKTRSLDPLISTSHIFPTPPAPVFVSWPFVRFHISIHLYSISVSLTSVSTVSSSSTQVVTNGRISFFLKAEVYIHLYIITYSCYIVIYIIPILCIEHLYI